MNIVSLNLSKIRTVSWNGQDVRTGIFKEPVEGQVRVGRRSLVGDEQADLSVHGGDDKAVYAYSWEHYAWWARNWEGPQLQPGAFGENLTIAEFDEGRVHVGDVFEIGDVILQAVQPRFPCYKLGIKFGNPAIIKTFMSSARLGVYFRVIKEGHIQKGDRVECVRVDPQRFPVRDLAYLFSGKNYTRDDLLKVLRVESLNDEWRARIEDKLTRIK